jgi:methionyl-tRNA synthetase
MTQTIHVSIAWPYPNGDPHAGHLVGCLLPGDIFARYHRLKGNRVLMVSGSDTHGTPIIIVGMNEGLTPRQAVEKYHHRFLEVEQQLGISFDLYTHTDTENHYKISQDFFLKLLDRGALYLAKQELLYDEQAGRFLPDRFVEGECPNCHYPKARGDQCDNCQHLLDALDLINPRSKLTGSTPVVRETEHYFLDLPKFQDQLRAYYQDGKDDWRPNVINFARSMVEDIKGRPITRDIDWGVPVPIDGWEGKCLYVWFEAVIGYFSASIEWAKITGQPEAWRDWWYDPQARVYNFLGKDNIPFHTIIWQTELMGVSGIYSNDPDQPLNLPYDVPANEFMNILGSKFSKSEHRAIWLPDLLSRYDPDAIRYYFTAVMPETRDSEFTWEDFVARNNNELVAWWGNLANRVLQFANKYWDGCVPEPGELGQADKDLLARIEAGFGSVGELLEAVKLRGALGEAMSLAREVNVYLDSAPWFGVVKTDKAAAAKTVYTALQAIDHLTTLISPFLPFTTQKLYEILGYNGQLFGDINIVTYQEETRAHEALVYDGTKATGRWEPRQLPPGQKLRQPVPLYKKLDEKVIEEELARMEAGT